MAHRSLIDTQQNFGTQVVDAGSDLSQSELATQAGLTAALMGVLELITPQHHVLLWQSDCAVLGRVLSTPTHHI